MPSACTPIRLISLLNSQRASYSRNPVAFTIGSDSKAEVLGRSTDFGFGNMQGLVGEHKKECCHAAIANARGQRKGGLCRSGDYNSGGTDKVAKLGIIRKNRRSSLSTVPAPSG